MALNDKLKQDIATGNIPEPEIANFVRPNYTQPQNDDLDNHFSELDESIKEINEAINKYEKSPESVFEEPKTNSNDVDAYAAIEKKLQDLEMTVAKLADKIGNAPAADYSEIFKSIDSAKNSISALLKNTQPSSMEERMKALEAAVELIGTKQDRNDRQIAQTLRENANFQIQVRQGMQKDIEELREQQNGEHFNPILKMISQVYAEYQIVFEDSGLSDKTKKNLKSLFSELEEILEEYEAEVVVSEEGSERKPRVSKIIEKVATGEKEKHNTIARSRKPGVIKGKMVLYPEFVDVYVYDESLDLKDSNPEINETSNGDLPQENQPEEVPETTPSNDDASMTELPKEEKESVTEPSDQTDQNNTEGK